MLLALLLTALGTADISRGGRVARLPDWSVSLVAGLGVTILGIWALGYGSSEWWLALVGAVVLAGWLEVGERSPRVSDIGLTLPLVVAVLALGFGQHVHASRPSIQPWYDDLAIPALSGVSFEKFALAVGCLVFLHSSANRVVRRVLTAAGPQVLATENTLKGGRILGPIERWFIFSMALSGQFVAVSAIVAANPQSCQTLFAAVFQDNPVSARVLTNAGFDYLGDAEAFSVARNSTVATWTYVLKLH